MSYDATTRFNVPPTGPPKEHYGPLHVLSVVLRVIGDLAVRGVRRRRAGR